MVAEPAGLLPLIAVNNGLAASYLTLMKKLTTIVVLAAGVAGVWYFTRDKAVAAAPEIVRAAVSRGAITETVQATGFIEPRRRVNVGSQVSGVVKELYVDFNSVVREGQLLAEIEPSLYEVQVQVQEANILRMQADLASQDLQLENLRRQLARVESAFAKDLQNQQQLDAARLNVSMRESQIASARTQLVQAEASLNAAKLNLSYTKIYSPIDGVVINRRVDKGQAVQASVTTPQFFMLSAPLETLRLTAWVDEADIGRVRPGMTVKFRVGTFGQELFDGTVDAVRLNASRTNEVVTYPVWIRVPNDDLRLRPGMTANVFIHVANTVEVTRIPNDALRFRPTRAIYAALGLPQPQIETVRAVDLAGDRVVDPTALRSFAPDEEADTIDELFAPLPRADARATVWTWDAAAKEFTSIAVRVGVTDGSTTELLSGDVQPGDELVTTVILPPPPGGRGGSANPLMGPQRGPRGAGGNQGNQGNQSPQPQGRGR
jgi:HlyD family secretion protein